MLMMTFTDLVENIETQSVMGWGMISLIVFNCLVNISVIILVGTKGVYLIAIKIKRIIKHQTCPAKKKEIDLKRR